MTLGGPNVNDIAAYSYHVALWTIRVSVNLEATVGSAR